MPDQLRTLQYWENNDRDEAERYAAGLVTTDAQLISLAKAGLLSRDRKWAVEQEADRREWTEHQEADRRAWEMQREQSRREFEAELVDKQVQAAVDVAKATKRAMWAAVAAAGGAIVQAIAAVISLLE